MDIKKIILHWRVTIYRHNNSHQHSLEDWNISYFHRWNFFCERTASLLNNNNITVVKVQN